MAKLEIDEIQSGYRSNAGLNANFEAIQDAIENTLSRDGTAPNTMSAVLDMNSNRIINVGAPNDLDDAVRLRDILDTVAIVVTDASIDFEFLGGRPPDVNETIGIKPFSITTSFEEDFAGSFGYCITTPTVEYVIPIYKNADQIGTVTIATDGTITFSGDAVTFTKEVDAMILKDDNSSDLTLADFAISFKGTVSL